MVFTIGQRWISNTESQLGLGIITELNGRQVHISFPAAEEERIYSKDNAPLSRIIFKEGEEINTSTLTKLIVSGVQEEQGLLLYIALDEHGTEFKIHELELSSYIKLSTPQQRLFSGLLDKLNAFKLRIETLNHLSRLQRSKTQGLLGARTKHIAHQIYIAHEVAQRHAPRVLLADEVGLGKTIEAGMILHYQLYTGRARRVLIVVPNTLIHQWFVEMRRRFNLNFSIFDQSRYDETNSPDSESMHDNFFETEQLILCSLDFLMSKPLVLEQATDTHWDLLVVDEAHHLHWSEKEKSPEYACIEQIASQSKGLLLLTATPEQVGIQSHFSRLKLLDPARFHDFNLFREEEEKYKHISTIVQNLLDYQESAQTDTIHADFKKNLEPYFDNKIPDTVHDVIGDLLDRHGTGRVLFRNTRAAISGFPERLLHAYPLLCPDIYKVEIEQNEITTLYPELSVSEQIWIVVDPRVEWLAAKIKELYPEKVLVICSKASTAVALEHHFKRTLGIRSAAFHEGLTIIERDRAAAYFSEENEGAQTLICSEIGSEGRNFQFSHHLVLFDLPLNPDLLEQRIGRLDRIGQRQTIQIHVPYLMDTAQEVLFHWYHEGIHSFEKSCSVANSIFENFKVQLTAFLMAPTTIDNHHFVNLIKQTKAYTDKLNQALSEGRDKLLELNSCNLAKAEELISLIEKEENSIELENYMSKVFQEYGIDQEHHSENTEIVRPTTHMHIGHFPGLNEEETTITYSRKKALVREDMQFLSWEHPMVYESMEMIVDSELGNATLTTISIPSIAPGTLFLETFYTINCAAPKHLQLERFLPLTPIRLFMDISGKNLSKILDYDKLNQLCVPVKRHLGYAVITQLRDHIETILKHSNAAAEIQMMTEIGSARHHMRDFLDHEITRLENLQKFNASIRDDEISFLKVQIKDSEQILNQGTLQLQAIRVVINK
ncbi:MAG: RNA polymerase-associated protein RapA [Legionella sp.]|nr:RNA polymerase-associated protein RapA [Legionella sp.]